MFLPWLSMCRSPGELTSAAEVRCRHEPLGRHPPRDILPMRQPVDSKQRAVPCYLKYGRYRATRHGEWITPMTNGGPTLRNAPYRTVVIVVFGDFGERP